MRLFFAIPLEPEVRDGLAAVQERLRSAHGDVKWVEPENFHLTVSFLGDQEESSLPYLQSIGEALAADTAPFRFEVRGASAFPRNKPSLKTLWVGIGQGAEAWKTLVKKAEPPLLPFGVPREGGLMPHITLGRVKSDQNTEALRAAVLAEASADCGAQTGTTLELVQSFLDPRGASYKTLNAWQLNVTNQEQK
ncbi:MAG: RNA 2',3'-cyclic phosphodiesterase [Cytophagales bacterium]|nr:RNA 2',3'-cyclic phosphodiesterase [Armatimonadota bacterium]